MNDIRVYYEPMKSRFHTTIIAKSRPIKFVMFVITFGIYNWKIIIHNWKN
jgi:hypothetical protein